ncbi:hypothetical protein GCM10020256_54270 [Streptomyces thermocoprophilus]
MSSEKLTVAVLGPGGVGGLLAALLARAGHRVTCLAGEATAEVLRTRGIQIRSGQFGDFTVPVEAAGELDGPVDAVLVAVKLTTLDAALARVPAKALGDALVVPFLNGVEHPALLRERYPEAQVAPGVIRVESTRVAPGVIEHGSPFTEIDLAGDTVPRAGLEALAGALAEAGPVARVVDGEAAALWAKMAFLAPFALLTTRYGVSVGEVRTVHREELTALVEETAAVSGACGGPRRSGRGARPVRRVPRAVQVVDAAGRGGGASAGAGRDRRGVAAGGGAARGGCAGGRAAGPRGG